MLNKDSYSNDLQQLTKLTRFIPLTPIKIKKKNNYDPEFVVEKIDRMNSGNSRPTHRLKQSQNNNILGLSASLERKLGFKLRSIMDCESSQYHLRYVLLCNEYGVFS